MSAPSIYTCQNLNNPSYLILAAAVRAEGWMRAVLISARHHVYCMMEGGGRSGPAGAQPSQGRGGNEPALAPRPAWRPRGKHAGR